MESEVSRVVDLNPDDQEVFGGEESYWTVYRMFVVGDNLGRPWTMDEILAHLAKNYDMESEDTETIHETLLDWAEDLKTDARERLGVEGSFVYTKGIYAFAERRNQDTIDAMNRAAAAKRRARLALAKTVQRPVEMVEVLPEAPEPSELILKALAEFDGGFARQSEVKRRVVSNGYDSELEDLQPYIEELIAAGDLYKVRRGPIAYLSLTPVDEQPEAEEIEQSKEEELFDIDTALDILRELCAPGTHYSQRVTISNLWRRIHEQDKSQAIPEEQIDMLKNACRQLRAIGLVSAGGERMGTGGVRTKSATSSKRRRSASQHVYKVGLVSQDMKKEIQNALDNGNIQEYLQSRFESLI